MTARYVIRPKADQDLNDQAYYLATQATPKVGHRFLLAAVASMGVSTLHHHFRALTAMSPLQYQKRLRLQMARQRMLMDGLDAASAAFEVGYESASQFNREYSRFFGQPPLRDVKALRAAHIVTSSVI